MQRPRAPQHGGRQVAQRPHHGTLGSGRRTAPPDTGRQGSGVLGTADPRVVRPCIAGRVAAMLVGRRGGEGPGRPRSSLCRSGSTSRPPRSPPSMEAAASGFSYAPEGERRERGEQQHLPENRSVIKPRGRCPCGPRTQARRLPLPSSPSSWMCSPPPGTIAAGTTVSWLHIRVITDNLATASNLSACAATGCTRVGLLQKFTRTPKPD